MTLDAATAAEPGLSAAAVLAILLGLLLLPVCALAYAVWAYRRGGARGPGWAFLVWLALVHLLLVWLWAVLPLPDPTSLRCEIGGAQLVPFAFVRDLAAGGAVAAGAARGMLVGVALFVPFGMLVRHLSGWRVWPVVAAGAVLALLVELTQFTGDWGIYRCAYRLADVDDVIADTLGAALGAFAAPLLARLPGQGPIDIDEDRPVRPLRRLLGMVVDQFVVGMIGVVAALLVAVVASATHREAHITSVIQAVVGVTTSVLVLLGVPLLAQGRTLGQLATAIRPVTADGAEPGLRAKLLRWAAGSGGWCTLTALEGPLNVPGLGFVTAAWAVASVAVVAVRHPRGLSGYASGEYVVDARDPRPRARLSAGSDARRLGAAVIALVAVVYVAFSGLAAIASVVPAVGVGLLLLGVVVVVAAALVIPVFLVANGLTTMRREGRSLATGLSFLAGVGLIVLGALLLLVFLTPQRWLAVAAMAIYAAAGYLGFLFVAFLLYGWYYARRPFHEPVDAVVALGSRVFGDRVPPLLAARIDRGVEIVHDQDAAGGRPVLVCTGGQGSDESVAEGVAMSAYARDAGLPADRVLPEDQARTTEENLRLSQALLRERGLGERMVFVTNDFHAFRTAIIARELGVPGDVVGAPTARYYYPSAVIREFVGVLARSPLLHAGVLAVLTLGVGGLTYLIGR